MPLAFGVIQRHIPIFGSQDASLYDRIFALILSVSFSIAYSVFISFTGKYFIGSISKSAIKNLVGGYIAGALLKMIIIFILFHTVYFYFLSEKFLARNLLKLKPLLKYETLERIYVFLIQFKPVFLISSYFLIFTTALMILIPLASIRIGSRKTKLEIEKEEKWR